MIRNNLFWNWVGAVALTFNLGCASEPGSVKGETLEQEAFARPQVKKPTVVLVHGAWADALGWQDVIGRLQHDGYPVRAVEIPLSSLALDVETTKRALDAASESGPLVVVAHSFGGAVITEAAAGNGNVKALVYLNAFAPDVGENLLEVASKFPLTPAFDAFVPDAAGFVTLDPSAFKDVFCADLSDRESAILAATQKPLSVSSFTVPLTAAAWREVPSWYLVGKQDRTVNPDLQRFFAERMHARVSEIDSSHLSLASHPNVVVRLIEEAAAATVR
jgi:pimeloyl-ACP methyl ester carboxylesterase